MKAKLQKLIGTAALGLALCSYSLPAWAGAASRNEVYISPSRTNVQGSLTGARYSADSTQSIGCGVYRSHAYGQYHYALCVARDSRGRATSCYSEDPRHVDAVKGMTDSSHIRFDLRDGKCELTIENSSLYLR